MAKHIKKMQMDSLRHTFGGVKDLVFLTGPGLDSQTDNRMRFEVRKKDIRLQVVKNSLAQGIRRTRPEGRQVGRARRPSPGAAAASRGSPRRSTAGSRTRRRRQGQGPDQADTGPHGRNRDRFLGGADDANARGSDRPSRHAGDEPWSPVGRSDHRAGGAPRRSGQDDQRKTRSGTCCRGRTRRLKQTTTGELGGVSPRRNVANPRILRGLTPARLAMNGVERTRRSGVLSV